MFNKFNATLRRDKNNRPRQQLHHSSPASSSASFLGWTAEQGWHPQTGWTCYAPPKPTLSIQTPRLVLNILFLGGKKQAKQWYLITAYIVYKCLQYIYIICKYHIIDPAAIFWMREQKDGTFNIKMEESPEKSKEIDLHSFHCTLRFLFIRSTSPFEALPFTAKPQFTLFTLEGLFVRDQLEKQKCQICWSQQPDHDGFGKRM